jgi:hypothetical protein
MPLKDFFMAKDRYQTQVAENITPLVAFTYSWRLE